MPWPDGGAGSRQLIFISQNAPFSCCSQQIN